MIKIIKILSVLLLFCSTAFATDYYVNCAAGPGGDGSIGTPWDTVSDVNGATFTGGDTIHFAKGCSWQELLDIDNINPNATSGNEVTFTSYGSGAMPEIDGSGGPAGSYTVTMDEPYVILDGLHITKAIKNNIGHTSAADNCIIRNCLIDYATRQGLYIGQTAIIDGDGWIVEDNTISNNGTSTLDHGIYIKYADNWIIQGNTFDNNYTNAIYLNTTTNATVRNNYSKNHTVGGFIQIYSDTGTGVSNSRIYGNRSNGDHRVVYEHITGGGNHSNNYFFNNTAYGFDRVFIFEDSQDLTVCKNNILRSVVASSRSYSTNAGSTIDYADYNLLSTTSGVYYNGSLYSTLALFQTAYPALDQNSFDDDPDFTNPGTEDFTLQSTSPAINAGTWLTTAASSGSGTQIQLSNAIYFISGDTVQFEGQVTTSTITSVNYSTNVINISDSKNWTTGQGIAFVYSGSIPDIGYDEYDSAPPASDPTVTITGPTSSATYNTTTGIITLSGTATSADSTIASLSGSCPTCTPSSFTVTCDDGCDSNSEAWTSEASIALSSGINVMTVTAIEADAGSGNDVVTVYQGQEGVIEAENCSLAGTMASHVDASASGGYYISTSGTNTGTATCSVVINTAGYYKFLGKVYVTGVGDNSFFVTVDEAASTSDTYAWDINAEENAQLWSTYYEEEISKRGIGTYQSPELDPLVVYLTADTHSVIIGGREVGARLDYIYAALIPNPGSNPTCTITSPTTSSSAYFTHGSSITVQGTATDTGTIAGGAYTITCNGSAFANGSITCDDAACDESSEPWTVVVGTLPIGECVFSAYSTDNGANNSDADILTFISTQPDVLGIQMQ